MEAEQVKTEEPSAHINLIAKNQSGATVSFRIKSTLKLGKLMHAYCNRNSLSMEAVRFLYNGERLLPDATPKEMKMESDDIIDVMMQQTGGGDK